MTEHDIMILKFGGSVLRDRNCFDVVVDECHRAVHSGHRVIAVISAYQGMTDMLQAEIDDQHAHLDPGAVTSLLSLGEVLAAGAAGLALVDSGLEAHVANAAELQLRAEGDPLDAHPSSVDVGAIRSILTNKQILVVPGFIAVDSGNRVVLLGRGGSDLTAVHLAAQLDPISTTIIRDVDGMYTHDPALIRGELRRFNRINYEDVAKLDASVMQPKAVECARRYGVVLTVRASHTTGGTLVGPGPTVLESDRSHQENNVKT